MQARRATKERRGHRNSQKTECPSGHPYDEENTAVWGGRRYCRVCSAENSRRQVVQKYGITLEDFQRMWSEQDGECAICRRSLEESTHIDHDHRCCAGKASCGKCIRGLLCRLCNIALGHFGDDPEVLERALRYLRG